MLVFGQRKTAFILQGTANMFFKIFKNMLMALCGVVLWLPLAACDEANPLIGDWVLNTSQMEPAIVARLQKATPDSRDNFMRLRFSGKYVLLGEYYKAPPKKKYLTPTDPEYYEDPDESKKPHQGRKIPVTYNVLPAQPNKKPVVEVMLQNMPKRDVTVYHYGDKEFIIWPVDGVEYRYERPKY